MSDTLQWEPDEGDGALKIEEALLVAFKLNDDSEEDEAGQSLYLTPKNKWVLRRFHDVGNHGERSGNRRPDHLLDRLLTETQAKQFIHRNRDEGVWEPELREWIEDRRFAEGGLFEAMRQSRGWTAQREADEKKAKMAFEKFIESLVGQKEKALLRSLWNGGERGQLDWKKMARKLGYSTISKRGCESFWRQVKRVRKKLEKKWKKLEIKGSAEHIELTGVLSLKKR
jgi:hypothetical protein